MSFSKTAECVSAAFLCWCIYYFSKIQFQDLFFDNHYPWRENDNYAVHIYHKRYRINHSVSELIGLDNTVGDLARVTLDAYHDWAARNGEKIPPQSLNTFKDSVGLGDNFGKLINFGNFTMATGLEKVKPTIVSIAESEENQVNNAKL